MDPVYNVCQRLPCIAGFTPVIIFKICDAPINITCSLTVKRASVQLKRAFITITELGKYLLNLHECFNPEDICWAL